jgi:hypothetical protein
MKRSSACLAKLDRLNKTLRHEEPDRVPVSDVFWGGFLKNWRESRGLAPDTDVNRFYDFDYVVTMPNTDPHIRDFEVLKRAEEEIVVRTGYEAVIKRKTGHQMPMWLQFETDTIEKMKGFLFDDPGDTRRFFYPGDHQIAGFEEEFLQNIPPWCDTVESYYPDFPVYGSLAEGYESLWRIIGSENALLWIALYPETVGRFVERINAFCLEFARAQIDAAEGMLDGMIIWGDVAYTGGMLFAPEYWRKYFRPGVKAIVELCHERDLPVIYHGCGDVSPIFEDFIEMGVDAYNPLEAKAGLDVVALRRKYGHRITFCGNMDVQKWAVADDEELKRIVLTKLNAAKGGGFIFQSDNSVPDNISVDRYEYVINLVREYGRFPLRLGEYDISELS